MKATRKTLAMLLALALVLCTVPAAFAAEEYFIDENTALVMGENQLTLSTEATYTLYLFCPEESGIFTLSVNEGATIGYWGAGTFYFNNPNSTATSIEQEIKEAGQEMLIGISSANPNVTLTIEKTGESAGYEQITYIYYENVHTPSIDNVYTGSDLTDVDITQPHTAVEGTDGLYHLDSAEGGVIYVALINELFNLPGVYGLDGTMGATRLRAEYQGTHYDFIDAMRPYAEAVDGTDGIYPLTADLLVFLQAYGTAQGWYNEKLSSLEEIQAGNFDADTAWMALCLYGEPTAEEPSNEEHITLIEGDQTVTMVPGISYYLSVDFGSLLEPTGVTLSWTEGVTVTLNGEVLASPYDLSNYSPRAGALVATVETETAVTFTVTLPEVAPAPELTLGDNAVVVTDGYNGTEMVFTATEAGEYTLAAAEGEENAYVMIITDYGAEGVDLPYTFTLAAGESMTFFVATYDYSADTIELTLTAASGGEVEPEPEPEPDPGEQVPPMGDVITLAGLALLMSTTGLVALKKKH